MLDRPSLPISEIVQIAANSALARVSWDGGRGRAPLGYIKGMAVMFAVAQRKLAQGDPAAVEMSRAASSDSHRDALAHYASRFAALGMRNDVSGIDTLRHLFVLMIGLGMRESSGRYCEGRDRSASNTSADSAEAGLFQMSWDAHGASRQIPRLLDEYQANGGGGYREIFCEGVTPHRGDLDNCGSGTGLRFQQLCKDCPGFAVETAAVGLRNLRTHWGPINRREAELRQEADDMLQQVQRLVASGVIIPDSPPVRDPVPPVHDVTWLQRSLNALGADPRLAEDGVYGRLTVAAVAQFQQQNSLSASGVADAATIAAIESKLRPTVPGPIPSGPTDLIALLERLVMLIEKLKGMRPMMDPSSGLSPTDRLRKTLDLLQAILSPGAAGKMQPLGQVNGALGQTIGNLLDGKKTAIGLLGAVATPLLTKASETATLGPLLGALTPAIGLSGFALPVFLGLTAWGVLGKMEKWSHGTAPPPRT
ncbi:MAG TPA: peptidoglycan-binding domain-containing protein [Xanthobacteraceae bacterium]|jgi:peptidoglycan hydrolase-like protein with peptidoglycan-binding domain|nr:peptidoglycan-binding domain-containing protein [Xanthobacteraceae bacterium]